MRSASETLARAPGQRCAAGADTGPLARLRGGLPTLPSAGAGLGPIPPSQARHGTRLQRTAPPRRPCQRDDLEKVFVAGAKFRSMAEVNHKEHLLGVPGHLLRQ